MADLKTVKHKAIKAKMPRHKFGESAPIGEEDSIPIGTTDIWGNGNNVYVQPAIGVQGFKLNAARRLLSTGNKR